jgi:hypothetical protein
MNSPGNDSPPRRQPVGGWSLPFSWMAVVAGALAWWTLGTTALVVVAATLFAVGFAIHRFRARPREFRAASRGSDLQHRLLVFRFETTESLSALREAIGQALGSSTLEHEEADPFEWLRGDADDGRFRIELALHRRNDEPGATNVAHGRLWCLGRGRLADHRGRAGPALAAVLDRRVTFGRVDDDDNSVFEEGAIDVFMPGSRPPDDRQE